MGHVCAKVKVCNPSGLSKFKEFALIVDTELEYMDTKGRSGRHVHKVRGNTKIKTIAARH